MAEKLKAVPAPVALARAVGLIRPTLGAAALGNIPVGFALEIGGGSEVWATVKGGMIADREEDDVQLTIYLDRYALQRVLDAAPLKGGQLCVRAGLTIKPPRTLHRGS